MLLNLFDTLGGWGLAFVRETMPLKARLSSLKMRPRAHGMSCEQVRDANSYHTLPPSTVNTAQPPLPVRTV